MYKARMHECILAVFMVEMVDRRFEGERTSKVRVSN
jgi:hypothetical protein